MGDRLSKRGRIWYAWIPNAHGKLEWKSTRCTDKDAARSVQERLEREAVDPTYRSANEAALDDVLIDYRASRVRLGRSEGTLEFVDTKIAHLSRLLPQRLPAHDHATLTGYYDKRFAEGARNTTIKKEVGVYRAAMRLAKKNGKFRGDVSALIPEIEDDYEARTRALTTAELQKLVHALLLPRTDLTHRQRMVLAHLSNEIERGREPTLRSVCRHFRWSSTNAATAHLRMLVAKGAIEIDSPVRKDRKHGLTDRQRAILAYLDGELRAKRSVTQRALAAHFGWSSNAAAGYHLGTFKEQGLITVGERTCFTEPAALALTPAGRAAARAIECAPEAATQKETTTKIRITGTSLEAGPTAPTPTRINRVALVLFSIAAGTRWGETCRAQRSHIDFDAGFVFIVVTKTKRKGRGDRRIPMTEFTRPLFEKVLALTEGRKGRLFDTWGSVRRDLRVACEQAGIEKVSPNDLRRTLGNWLAASGADDDLIGNMLGHTDGRMARRVYGQKRPEQLARVVNDRLKVGGVAELARAASGIFTIDALAAAAE
jgi:integrase